MDKVKALTAAFSMIFLLTIVSSVRADSVRSGKLDFGVLHTLELPNMSKTEFRDFLVEQIDESDFGGLLAERFEGNNGLHLGLFKTENNGKHFGTAANSSNSTSSSTGDDEDGSVGGNSGKHIGFSVAFFNPGMRFGLVNPRHAAPAVSQNPEPTGMLLLGTGLAAVAGFARRSRRRRHTGNR